MQGLPSPPVEQVLEGRAVEHEELEVPGPDGAPDVKLSVYRPSAASAPGPCLYFIHGGGMIIGDRYRQHRACPCSGWTTPSSVEPAVVSVDYRLAPATPGHPGARWTNCYAGLAWAAAARRRARQSTPARLVVGWRQRRRRPGGGGRPARPRPRASPDAGSASC